MVTGDKLVASSYLGEKNWVTESAIDIKFACMVCVIANLSIFCIFVTKLIN